MIYKIKVNIESDSKPHFLIIDSYEGTDILNGYFDNKRICGIKAISENKTTLYMYSEKAKDCFVLGEVAENSNIFHGFCSLNGEVLNVISVKPAETITDQEYINIQNMCERGIAYEELVEYMEASIKVLEDEYNKVMVLVD